MAGNDEYVFVTRWRVAASTQEVFDILEDPEALPRWWPAVYLAVRRLPDGTVDLLAPEQGAALAQTEARVLVEVQGVATLTDYANVERILESLPGVRGANIARAGANSVTFDMTARGGSEAIDSRLEGREWR